MRDTHQLSKAEARATAHQPSGIGRISHLLMLAGFTEEQAASGLGVDEATVREWCEGHADPPKEVIDALERLVAQGP